MNDFVEREMLEVAGLYGLQVDFYETHGRVYKIYSDKGEFALKKISAHHGVDFLYYVQHLYQRGYHRIVPIYPTFDGRYAVLQGKNLYYLMPWVENREREDHYEKYSELFRELARLHTISAREVEVSVADREDHYNETVAQWEKERDTFERLVEQSEKSWYMSPFQLLFCTFYHEITLGQTYALRKLQEWYELTKEEEKARSVIIHGKLSAEHFLLNEQGLGFFSNFEKANVASPIHDILPFLARVLKTYPKQFDESVEWITTYFSYFPFKEEEMLLFLSYLAYPSEMFHLVESYFATGKEKDEFNFVCKLQRQYWHMKNIEYVIMKIEQNKQQQKDQTSNSSPSN